MDIEVVEPQADTVEDVAVQKAVQVYKKVSKRPFVVEDGGLSVPCWNGFPGPYTKYVMSTLGMDLLLPLISCSGGIVDCHFVSSVVYVDANFHIISGVSRTGVLVDKPSKVTHPDQWSDLWKIFVPEGYSVPLSECYSKDFLPVPTSPLNQFGSWLSGKELSGSVYKTIPCSDLLL